MAAASLPAQAPAESVITGRIIERIICQRNPRQSYALFLPSEYSPDTDWPIIYIFDPGGRGTLPLEHFLDAAEKYNYIIAASHNARNGPWKPIIEAAYAVWLDTKSRFPIDPQRIYAAGFSGGSRAASLFSKIIDHPVAGVIGCGAGLATEIRPGEIPPTIYCGIVGYQDFNYIEMVVLQQELAKQKVRHRMLYFTGEHSWPPPEICQRAVAWMEVVGMQHNIRPFDKGIVDNIFSQEFTLALDLERADRLLDAAAAYTDLISTYQEYRDIGVITAKLAGLSASRKYLQQQKEHKERTKEELRLLKKHRNIMYRSDPGRSMRRELNNIFSDLEVTNLLRIENESKKASDRQMASRLLLNLWVNSRRQGQNSLEQKNFHRALIFFEVALKAQQNSPDNHKFIYYDLARTYALNKNKKQVLKYLHLAVEYGWEDEVVWEQEPLLEFIRSTPEFQELIKD